MWWRLELDITTHIHGDVRRRQDHRLPPFTSGSGRCTLINSGATLTAAHCSISLDAMFAKSVAMVFHKARVRARRNARARVRIFASWGAEKVGIYLILAFHRLNVSTKGVV